MIPVPTALLLHTTDTGRHHDWLVGDPLRRLEPEARLWTARLEPPSWQWADLGRFPLTVLPPHRPRYLKYEGPISHNRGKVRRVDAGYALVLRWATDLSQGAGTSQGENEQSAPMPTSTAAAKTKVSGPRPPVMTVMAVMAVRMRHFAGRMALIRSSDGQWEAQVIAADSP